MPVVDRQLVVTLLQDLVRIPSVHPDLVPGAPGEADVADFIATTLRGWGLAVEVSEAGCRPPQRRRHAGRHRRRSDAPVQWAHGHGQRRGDGRALLGCRARWPAVRPRRDRHEGIARGDDGRDEGAGRRWVDAARGRRVHLRGRRGVREHRHRGGRRRRSRGTPLVPGRRSQYRAHRPARRHRPQRVHLDRGRHGGKGGGTALAPTSAWTRSRRWGRCSSSSVGCSNA